MHFKKYKNVNFNYTDNKSSIQLNLFGEKIVVLKIKKIIENFLLTLEDTFCSHSLVFEADEF